METIAIVGSGLIGSSWAVLFASAGHSVRLFDAAEGALERTKKYVTQTGHGEQSLLARISESATLEDALRGADYVQESITETVAAKTAIFREIDEFVRPHAVVASSSSSIRASLFTADLQCRARCLIAHPLNPPHLLSLVEIVPAPWTDATAVARAKRLLEGAGKSPIVLSREIPGFVVNRLQGALLHEAFRLVEDGTVSPQDIDIAMTQGLGLRWASIGPFEAIDLNAPGGIQDYARRYGAMFLELASERGSARPWSEELVGKIAQLMRSTQALSREAREALRDDRLRRCGSALRADE